jgi:hypothetical protein
MLHLSNGSLENLRRPIRASVAQASGLPYRRLPVCERRIKSRVPIASTPADYKSAIQQTRGLRYEMRPGSQRSCEFLLTFFLGVALIEPP